MDRGLVALKLGWENGEALVGLVGTKDENPVCVGINGLSRPWLLGTGAKGPLGPDG